MEEELIDTEEGDEIVLAKDVGRLTEKGTFYFQILELVWFFFRWWGGRCFGER